MIGFLLGAGLGTRLRPLTNYYPKPLVPFYDVPLAWHSLQRMKDCGISRAIINTHHLPEAWPKAISKFPISDLDITLRYEPEALETGGGLRNIKDLIDQESVLVHNGDIYSSLNLEKLIAAHKINRAAGKIATLALRSAGDVCNVAFNASSGEITDMRGHFGAKDPLFQFTGIYITEPEIINDLPDKEIISIVPAFLNAIARHEISGIILDDELWLDLGTPEIYRNAHHLVSAPQDWENGIAPSAQIAPSAILENCVIYPNAKISANCHLSNCIVWPNRTVPENSILRDQVIFNS